MLLFKIVFLFYDQVVAKLRYNKTLIKQTKASALLRKKPSSLDLYFCRSPFPSMALPSVLLLSDCLNSSVDQSLFNI